MEMVTLMKGVQMAATAIQVIGALQGGSQQQAQQEAAARASEYNAAVARQRADSTTAAYGQREQQQRRAASLQAGQRSAAMAQSGMGTGGSNADLERQSSIMSELDALNIRYEGATRARGLLAQSEMDTYSAASSRMAGSMAKQGSYLAAAGKLMSGTGDYIRTSRTPTPAGSSLNLG